MSPGNSGELGRHRDIVMIGTSAGGLVALRIRPRQIFVAPNDSHLTLHRDFVRVPRGLKENGHRPAVDLVTEPIPEQAEADAAQTVVPRTSLIVCPSCDGSMVESVEGGLLRSRCHVGHAFSVDSLLTEQSESLEAALWASVRCLEESAQLADRLANSSDRRLAPRLRDKAAALRQHAGLIQDVLLHGTTLDTADAAALENTSLES